jgi:hypothetical protein
MSGPKKRSGRRRGKPRRETPKYERDLQRLAEQYMADHPGPGVGLQDVAEWMISHGLWEQKKSNAVRELMRHLQQALRNASILDENGDPVRKYHAIPGEKKQACLWSTMEEISPDNMRASLQARSGGAFGIVKQIDRDKNYFNKNHNPGDPIQMSFNYDARLEDDKHSDEYVDQPPPDEPDEPTTDSQL